MLFENLKVLILKESFINVQNVVRPLVFPVVFGGIKLPVLENNFMNVPNIGLSLFLTYSFKDTRHIPWTDLINIKIDTGLKSW